MQVLETGNNRQLIYTLTCSKKSSSKKFVGICRKVWQTSENGVEIKSPPVKSFHVSAK